MLAAVQHVSRQSFFGRCSLSTATFSGLSFEVRQLADGVCLPVAAWDESAAQVLTPNAVAFLAALQRRFGEPRERLLAARFERQKAFDEGALPEYLARDSDAVRGDWKVAPIPSDLQTRRVEITGPVNSTKMVIQMLSRTASGSRADCAMLDFEDSMKPSWRNVIDGVQNVIGAVRGELTFEDEQSGKRYALDADDMAVVMVRARGLHLAESNFLVDGRPMSAGLFDLGLTWFHAAPLWRERGKTPKYYIPKCEHYLEARWWNDVFSFLEDHFSYKRGTLRATFLIETLTAAFQIEEILYELREHAAALNVGRWDKIFSDIKTLRYHAPRIMADRGWINMERDWMKNYAARLIRICHERGAFALGGMAAFTPGRDAATREKQSAKVLADKKWEFAMGHDGCWVSHPYFIGMAMNAFPKTNQIDVLPDYERYPDLLPRAEGPRTMDGVRTNIRVGIAYMEGWARDVGCVAWDNLMEDLATLEISRAQIWQWLHHKVVLDDGPVVDEALIRKTFDEELQRILEESAEAVDEQAFRRAAEVAVSLFLQQPFPEFLSLASDLVVADSD